MENLLSSAYFLLALLALLAAVGAVSALVTYKFTVFVQRFNARKNRNHPLWKVSRIERTHFDEATIKVNLNGLDIKARIGVDLSTSEVIALSGATTGSTVSAKYMTQQDWDSQGTGVDKPPPGLYFDVTGPLVDQRVVQTVGIVKNQNGDAELYLKDIFFSSDAPSGLAGRMLVRMVRAALDLGIPELRLLAAGGRTWPNIVGTERWGGYLAWAIYGFDMPVETKTRQMYGHFPNFPQNLANCYTVQSVLALDGGRDFWKVVGDGWFMRFDASQLSTPSINALMEQVTKKGV